jgi:hypothetical protein
MQMPQMYIPPLNTPLYWGNEQTGVLQAAILAYFEHKTTSEQLQIVLDYCRYVINAPCWKGPDGVVEAVQKQASEMRTQEDIDVWIEACMELGIDPL